MKTPMQKLQFDLEAIQENQDNIEIEKVLDAIRFTHRPNEKQVIIDAVEFGEEFGSLMGEDLGNKYIDSIFN